METNSLYIIIAIVALYIFIANFFYLYIMPKRKKRIKRAEADKAAHLVPLHRRLMKIKDPKELEEVLSKLTDEQLQEHEEWLERDKYNIDNIGHYLRDRFDEMKPGDYRRNFIFEIVYRFRLESQFGYLKNKGKSDEKT